MTALENRSTAELRRLRDRATNETIRELLNAELAGRWNRQTDKEYFRYRYGGIPIPGQP